MVSLVGIFLNPIVILTAEIIVLAGFIWVSLPLGTLAPTMGWIIGGAAKVQNAVVEYASSLPYSALDVELPEWVVVVGYLMMGVGVLIAVLWKDRKQWRVES
jgi:hypothetical protein